MTIHVAFNGVAQTEQRFFSRETAVSVLIRADKATIWSLLTNASGYTKWNSEIISIQGCIAQNEKIILRSTLDPNRDFKLTIKEFKEESSLVWGNVFGKQIFILHRIGINLTNFTMHEKIRGPLFPLAANTFPSFEKSLERFANQLKIESEIISKQYKF
jgi:hypothetical protein